MIVALRPHHGIPRLVPEPLLVPPLLAQHLDDRGMSSFRSAINFPPAYDEGQMTRVRGS